MPHRNSGIRHVRADNRKRIRNRLRKTALRTTLRQTEAALTEGNAQDAQTLYQQAASLLDKAAQKGVIKKGMANRKKSRLARRLNQIEAA